MAVITNDYSSFLLLGKTWTLELSQRGAELSRKLSQNNDEYIEGGYRDTLLYPCDMIEIYRR
jgi:hypothetical protein